MVPVTTSVTCTHCGAVRVYNIRGTFMAAEDRQMPVHKHRYDVWRFTKEAACPHHGGPADHRVTLDEYMASIVCSECGFTHLYDFALFDRNGGR